MSQKQSHQQEQEPHQQPAQIVENDKNIINEQPKSKYDSLTQHIDDLTKKLEKRAIAKKEKKIKKRDELNDLADSIQEQSNIVVSKLEDLSRKPTIFISVSKIIPQIPEGFPKNYNVQVVYEDVTVTGNQKFVDFDENVIDQKFILPLLSSETAKFEVWVAQDEPSLFDKAIINLEKDLEAALVDPNYQNQINFQSNAQLSVSYSVQLQGIGFSAWLKNLASFREADGERLKMKKQSQMKKNQTKQKVQQKKNRFKQKFEQHKAGQGTTKEYNLKGIDDILDDLGL